jgi:hypothetical protein
VLHVPIENHPDARHRLHRNGRRIRTATLVLRVLGIEAAKIGVLATSTLSVFVFGPECGAATLEAAVPEQHVQREDLDLLRRAHFSGVWPGPAQLNGG